jgi:hypothetical protein
LQAARSASRPIWRGSPVQTARRARAGEIALSDAVMGALSVGNLDLGDEPMPPLELARRQPLRIYGVLLESRLDFTSRRPRGSPWRARRAARRRTAPSGGRI